MAVNNATILDRIWLRNSNQYQQSVPQATQAGVSQVMKAIFDPQNNMLYNQFMSGFINLIGQQRVNQQAWTNPLAKFKGPKLNFGSSIQESAVAWITAHSYDAASQDLLKLETPEAAVWYHSLNREDKYPISVDRPALMQAFRDEYGLNKLINQIIQVPINSDNFDEYNLMMNLFSEYEHRWGFYKHQVSALPSASDTAARETLKAMRTYSDLLKFPSVQYNATAFDIPIPVFVNEGESLICLVSAAEKSAIDVDGLAQLFHLEKAETPNIEFVVVPEIPVPGVFAILTTKDFFVVDDVVYQTTSFFNPDTLTDKYILHHWEIVSCSPWVPAIALTTEASTAIPVVTQTVTGIDVTAEATTLHPGETTQLTTTISGSLSGSDSDRIKVAPNAVTWEIAANDVDGEAFDLNSRTYVDRLGVLHIQKGGWKFSETVTEYTVAITATSTYINPSGATTAYTDTIEITVEQ